MPHTGGVASGRPARWKSARRSSCGGPDVSPGGCAVLPSADVRSVVRQAPRGRPAGLGRTGFGWLKCHSGLALMPASMTGVWRCWWVCVKCEEKTGGGPCILPVCLSACLPVCLSACLPGGWRASQVRAVWLVCGRSWRACYEARTCRRCGSSSPSCSSSRPMKTRTLADTNLRLGNTANSGMGAKCQAGSTGTSAPLASRSPMT